MRSRTPHRGGLLAATLAATLLVAACGSPAGNDATGKPPAKIRITGAGSGTGGFRSGEASPALATEGSDDAGADSKVAGGLLPGGWQIEYVVEGTLPALDGDAPAWHYPAANGVKAADVTDLAEQLGLTGDVREVPEEEGGGWRVGSTDYTAPWLAVERTGMGTWYYDAAAYRDMKVACAGSTGETASEPATAASAPLATTMVPPVAPDGGGGSGSSPAADCPAPTPPANVPSADEARTKAMALAEKLGAVPDAADVRVEGDEWGRYVTWSFRLGGMLSPVSWSATYGGDGVLMSASGSLATAEQAADYPRVGTAAALEQLRSGQAWGAPAAMEGTTGGGAASSGASDDAATGTGSTGTAVASPGSESVAPAIAPSPPMTMGDDPEVTLAVEPPQPVTMTVTGVEATLYLLFGVDGEVWLVPGYRFTGPTGDVAVVPAIDSSYVEQVTPADGGVAAQSRGGVDAPPPATTASPAKP